jgi:hypothetical protein
MKPQITTHYADGRPSETRDMTDKEIALLPPEVEPDDELGLDNGN